MLWLWSPNQSRDDGVALQIEHPAVPDPDRSLIGGTDVGDAVVPG